MSFANPLPWWALGLVAVAAAAVAWQAYRLAAAPPAIRIGLSALRVATLLLLVVILMRPVERAIDAGVSSAIVPVLVDVSRSMAIEDADGARRIEQAKRLLADRLLPALGSSFQVELLSFGESLRPADVADLSAVARRSDLDGAMAALLDRYRGQPLAGIVLLSDGGFTESPMPGSSAPAPVFPLGIGASRILDDREVLSVTAAEAVLDGSRVPLSVSAVSHGRGTGPFDLRLLENGRPVEVKRVTPAADGLPVHAVFHVAPPAGSAVVYTVEIPEAAGELVPENNARRTLVQPPSRPRRVLVVEGAPGYEHSFLKRALGADTGLEIDAVVRKGRNDQGRDTFYIQAAPSRSAALRTGYAARPEDLFQYDAVVLANVPGHQLTRAQLEATRAFVGRRGGGLLVLGAHAFLQRGLIDTALEEALPLDLADRSGGVLPASGGAGLNRAALTPEGEAHPITQLGADSDETRRRWEALPALAAISPLGAPRAGASVLAVTGGTGGASRALVAVQRFGEGRSMVFTGEASWRWRMLRPADDRAYDTFWRQAVRWLALPATDPVAIVLPASADSGDTVSLTVVVRDAAFEPLRDAAVVVGVTAPDGRFEELRATADPSVPGRYITQFGPRQGGVHRITAEARANEAAPVAASASLLVGAADQEMSDPRLNEHALNRIAAASGGRVVAADDVEALAGTLRAGASAATLAVRQDLWHNGWWFAGLIALLSAEWVLRRRGGLR